MSEMTQCNFCSLRRYKERAEKTGMTIRLVKRPSQGFPDGLDIHKLKPGEEPNKKNKIGWFAKLTDHCCC